MVPTVAVPLITESLLCSLRALTGNTGNVKLNFTKAIKCEPAG